MKEKTTKFDSNKKRMLEALEKSLGIVTSASKQANIHRSSHYNWMNPNHELYDADYVSAVQEVENVALDFAESQLHQKIQGVKVTNDKGQTFLKKEPDTTAIIFYLKTKGKKRGYVERIENESINPEPIQVEIIETDGEVKSDD
jgi:hypothetical protein